MKRHNLPLMAARWETAAINFEDLVSPFLDLVFSDLLPLVPFPDLLFPDLPVVVGIDVGICVGLRVGLRVGRLV